MLSAIRARTITHRRPARLLLCRRLSPRPPAGQRVLRQTYDANRIAIDHVLKMAATRNSLDEGDAGGFIRERTYGLIGLGVTSTQVTFGFASLIAHGTTRPMRHAAEGGGSVVAATQRLAAATNALPRGIGASGGPGGKRSDRSPSGQDEASAPYDGMATC